MLIDFNNNIEIPNKNIDFCIIGSGAAGSVIFDMLSNGEKNILLIESGDITPAGEAQELNNGYLYLNGKLADKRIAEIKSALHHRTRGLGGSTNCWSGACKPFQSITFKKRDWVINSGWDIEEKEISNYYEYSNKYTEIDSNIYDYRLWDILNKKNPTGIADEIKTSFSIRSGYLNFKSKAYLDWQGPVRFNRYLTKDIHRKSKINNVLYNATVIDLTYNKDYTGIKSCTITNNNNIKKIITAKYFILCGGGFENPRLLLMGNQGGGVGNIYGNVGRYYNGHPYGTVADLVCNNNDIATELGWKFQYHKINNNRCSPHLFITEESQIKYKLLNTAFGLVPELDELSASYKLKSILEKHNYKDIDISTDDLLLMIYEIDDILSNSYKKLTNSGAKLRMKKIIPIEYIAEGIPKFNSRISLSNEKDKFGCFKIKYNWELNTQEIDNLYNSLKLFATLAQRKNWGFLRIRDISLPNSIDNFRGLVDATHPSGGTRISKNPRFGVVNTDLKVHDLNNLYICGSSVFPTNGYESPTYTIIALAARLSQHLNKILY